MLHNWTSGAARTCSQLTIQARVDETYIKVKGEDRYLYRAVDSDGNTLDFLLTARRNAQAAQRFFRKTLQATHTQEPRVINVAKNAACPKAIDEFKGEKKLSLNVELRQNKYLNNMVELSASIYQTIDQTRDGISLVQYSPQHTPKI